MGASADAGRDLSVVVFGATGIAGRSVAGYLAERAGEVGASWAVAGRDPAKIERVLGELGVSAPETIVADVRDPDSLAAMASRARAVVNLVGPYTTCGEPVVAACVANGAHYADLTGEMPFVRHAIDAHGEGAEAAGVKLIFAAGYEALPPDLAVLLAAETARERWGEELSEVDATVSTRQPRGRPGLSDAISGGTLQSAAEAIAGEDTGRVTDPAALLADPGLAEHVRRRSPIALAPWRDSRGRVIAPMTPAAYVNPAVIHRTMALDATARGADPIPFRYREGIALAGGPATLPLRYAAAGALAATQAGFGALTKAPASVRRPVAAAMRRVLPSSGFGPTGERLQEWSWRVAVEARTASGHAIRVDVDGDGHPGYLATSRMIAEVGLMLAEGATTELAGCLTPATALGTVAIPRLERAGVRFSVSGDG